MSPQPDKSSPPLVLLVEDSEHLRRACTMTLQRATYAVVTATSAQHALELLTELDRPPNLLIVDLQLPDMGGTAFVARAGLRAPVLYLSGDARALAAARRVARPSDAVLAKPFSTHELLAVTRLLLGAENGPTPDPA